MEIDPPGALDSPPAPSPSSKRPKEEEADDAAAPVKRVKPDPTETAIEAAAQIPPKPELIETALEGAAESSKVPKTKTDKRGEGRKDKKQRGKKGKDREKEKDFLKTFRKGTRPDGEEAVKAENGEPKAPRLPKRPCALLLGFCGDGYNGMQIQPDPKLRTIEGVLFEALIKVGAVSEDNSDNPTKVKLARAARTDAGVHAAGNVVSMKLINDIPGVPDLVARINEELPPEIRIWSIVRVQNSFNARTTCDSRKYTYFFPSYLMIPPKPNSGLHNTLKAQGLQCASHPFWENADPAATSQDDLRRKREYRIAPEPLAALREAAKKFEGSHNFHNFTVGRDFRDRSCQRFLKSIELYGPRPVFIPKMPALGLLLEYPIFESYSRRVQGVNAKLKEDDAEYRAPIDFELHRAQLDDFKEHHIYAKMRSIEDQHGMYVPVLPLPPRPIFPSFTTTRDAETASVSFDGWIRSIDAYAGHDLEYLNPKGIVPQSAVIKKGEHRNNPFREKKRYDATSFPTGKIAAAGAAEEEEESSEDEEAHLPLDKEELADLEG
ncbi:tRNA pseudouridine synthase 1 [Trametes pubescens]|uniref:tRNA pseudouridine synthase 1 n=1 Tax=Trametes pubescens TaxID=154538 RepID=A0A1M2VJ49_TRAPU|nr:tRNA pseudouridine synthase 1 [Trametes pubescens]